MRACADLTVQARGREAYCDDSIRRYFGSAVMLNAFCICFPGIPSSFISASVAMEVKPDSLYVCWNGDDAV
jgi:hypothetical protein